MSERKLRGRNPADIKWTEEMIAEAQKGLQIQQAENATYREMLEQEEAYVPDTDPDPDPTETISTAKGFGSRNHRTPRKRKTAQSKGRSSASTAASFSRDAIQLLETADEIIAETCRNVPSAHRRREVALLALKSAGVNLPRTDLLQKIKDIETDELRSGIKPGFLGREQKVLKIQPDRWLINERIKEGELNLFAGPSGAGKTHELLDIVRMLLQKEGKWLNSEVSGFTGNVIYVGVDNRIDFFINKFSARGIGKILSTDSEGNKEYVSDLRLDFDPNDGVFNFSERGLSQFEERYLKPGGAALEAPLVIIDSASTVLSDMGVQEKDDLQIGLLVDFTRLMQRYNATSICVFHMPKGVTMFDVGARAIRGHSGLPQVAGQVITLGLLDDKSSDEKQMSSIPLRHCYCGHRAQSIDEVIRQHYDGQSSEVIGNFHELNNNGELQGLINEERGRTNTSGGEIQPRHILNNAVLELSGTSREIFSALTSIDVEINSETDWAHVPTTEIEALRLGYRTADQLAELTGTSPRTVNVCLQANKPLMKARKKADDASLVSVIQLKTLGRPKNYYRAFHNQELTNGEY